MIFHRCVLWLFFCSAVLRTASALEPTKYQELPVPFSYVENLYFCPSIYFIAMGDEPMETHKIIEPIKARHYRLISLSNEPKQFPRKLAYLLTHPVHLLENTSVILMEYDKNFFFHFFHLLEHLVGIWAFYGYEHADDVHRIILARDFSNADNNWIGPNQINKHLLTALFPHAEIWTWEHFIKECKQTQGLACFERAVISDRAGSVFNPECGKINKHLGAALPYINPKHMDSFAMRVQEYAATKREDSSDQLHVTYIKRPPPRCLSESVERRLIEKISALPNVKLHVEDFAKIPFMRQINLIGNTDVLISIHGNGLSHLLFLPSTSCVIELFPPDCHQCDYHVFSEARGVDYFGLMYNEKAFLDRTRSFQLSSYGDINSTIEELDVDLIVSTIRSRLKKP
jgi:Glycosyltransferase 61